MNRPIALFGAFFGGAALLAAAPFLSSLHLVGAGTTANAAESPGAEGLVVHEWGTFTSLQASTGVSLEGLHHEDELLPDFVHSRLKAALVTQSLKFGHPPDPDPTPTWSPCPGKGCDFTPHAGTALGVTQKMETPVIYFYSRKPQNVRVNVDFPGGLITQWYPDVSGFSPPAGQVQSLSSGQAQWDVKLSTTDLPLPTIGPASIWAPSRAVPANALSAAGENERFIFYRGLGRFTTPVQVRSELGQGLRVADLGDIPVADAFLIHVGKSGGHIEALGEIPAHGALSVPAGNEASLESEDEPMDAYLARATGLIEAALVRSGLYSPEAQAMANTWKVSYFKTTGLRVLYVLPRAWTDSLLPLRLDPQPQELARTLVGRIEVMTADEELSLLDRLSRTVGRPDEVVTAEVAKLGRFAEGKLRREVQVAHEQGASPAVVAWIARRLEIEAAR